MTDDLLTLDRGESPRVILRGDWTLANYSRLRRVQLSDVESANDTSLQLDASEVSAMDTSGATILLNLFGAETLAKLTESASGLSRERQALLQAVAQAVASQKASPPPQRWRFTDSLADLGAWTMRGWGQVLQFLDFLGVTLVTLASLIPRPWRWRWTALIAQMHHAGLNAVPIVMLLNFLVGAVVAFLGATVLADFGATIYTVDLVAYAFMRELGVLLAAILLAGRTASAFAAQIGSMKINEELDALRVQDLSPIELLVLPRVLALVIVLPLLTFLSIMAGMAGGAVVAAASLDISLAQYLTIVQDIPIRHMLLGISKAPVFAMLIALIGCLEGMKVAGSAQSVGEHTTSAVVQSIFVVILLDAVAALFFMQMGW
ncbi:MAG: ABC transporter permease [Pseudomonadota bacterium]|nr:ABC transporter permease [Pseudomonadota bacterium]